MLEKDFDIDKEENFQLKENQVNDCNEFLEKKEIVTENQKEQYLNEEESLFNIIFRVFFIMYPTRFLYALCLMVSQAFFYNGVYYTYGLVLENFFKVEKEEFGIYMIPLSISNFLGPITLGFLFDIWSRRKMIFLSYFISGVLLIISGITFTYDLLTVKDQILLWCSVFFIASPGTSAAHLTVSEVFPIDIRSQAMAIFFSISMLIGGVIAPVLFATLISQNDRYIYAYAYYISAVLMIGSSIICLIYGVDAEGKSLESLTGEVEPSTEKKEVLVKSSVS